MAYYPYSNVAQWNGRLPTAKTLQHITYCGGGRKVPLGMARARELRKLLEEKDLGTARGVLRAINRFVDAYGVESIPLGGLAGLYYVNCGDTYDHTVLYNQKTGNIYCGSWGDFVESHGL